MGSCGTLYIVSTPIGNLSDMTFRAIEILKSVSVIASEDTRKTRKLLSHYDIHTKMIAYHEHNEQNQSDHIIDLLSRGEDVALVSEAGTPTISDPGYRLVSKVRETDHVMVPIPGASAVVSALSVSGLPTDCFYFVGFLPDKPGKRKKRIEAIADLPATLVFYVSKWKVKKVLTDLLDVLGDRPASFSRELTKMHEETVRADLSELLERFGAKEGKGEITLVVSGNVHS